MLEGFCIWDLEKWEKKNMVNFIQMLYLCYWATDWNRHQWMPNTAVIVMLFMTYFAWPAQWCTVNSQQGVCWVCAEFACSPCAWHARLIDYSALAVRLTGCFLWLHPTISLITPEIGSSPPAMGGILCISCTKYKLIYGIYSISGKCLITNWM